MHKVLRKCITTTSEIQGQFLYGQHIANFWDCQDECRGVLNYRNSKQLLVFNAQIERENIHFH